MSETSPFSPVIKDYAQGGFSIGDDFYHGSIQITGAEGSGYAISPWNVADPETLTTEDFDLFLNGEDRPDLIVLGVGSEMKHPFAKLRMKLTAAGIPLEVQTTAAACRTWNLLLSEGRRVGFAAFAMAISSDGHDV